MNDSLGRASIALALRRQFSAARMSLVSHGEDGYGLAKGLLLASTFSKVDTLSFAVDDVPSADIYVLYGTRTRHATRLLRRPGVRVCINGRDHVFPFLPHQDDDHILARFRRRLSGDKVVTIGMKKAGFKYIKSAIYGTNPNDSQHVSMLMNVEVRVSECSFFYFNVSLSITADG